MRKYLAVAAFAVLVAFAAPAFASVNPFIDVPPSHWAYDAIGQLAARGILSGYPDGTYKGRQPTTRFEMASALARALALVDMSKASKQDVELLKKLVVEFKDELDAFGVRLDSFEERFGRMERRLGGWRISGQLRQDITYRGNVATNRFYTTGTGDDAVTTNVWRNEYRSFAPLARARLFLERWFGPDESIHFFARFEGANGSTPSSQFARGNSNGDERVIRFNRFYATAPFGVDGNIRVGRQTFDDLEAPYYLDVGTPFSKFMSAGGDTVLYDRLFNAVRVNKNFGGMGSFTFIVGNENLGSNLTGGVADVNAWMATLHAKGQFTERWGLDVGINAYLSDDSGKNRSKSATEYVNFKNLWTAYGGLRFDFTPAIALKGLYHYQSLNANRNKYDGTNWVPEDIRLGRNKDYTNNWKVILDVKQDLLKFTGLWLEYNRVDAGFWVPVGASYLFHDGDFMDTTKVVNPGGSSIGNRGNGVHNNNVLNYDMNLWRVAAQQEWNDKWTTFLFYENATLKNVPDLSTKILRNQKFDHYGAGFVYQYNPSVGFGLTYHGINYNRGSNEAWNTNKRESMIRFRTHVAF